MNVWSILGIQATSDEREIKRAYACKLKSTRPEDDPRAFQELRDAYQASLQLARFANQHGVEPDDGEGDEQPVYTAAYEWDPDGGGDTSSPQLDAGCNANAQDAVQEYVAAWEFEPVAPMLAARLIWADFLTSAHRDTALQLLRLEARDDMLDLEVRECFELCALQYCAGEGCDDGFRVALADHFQWEANHVFICRDMPEEAAAMLARLHEYRYSR